MIGYGELEDFVVNKIKEDGLSDCVSYLGSKTPTEVREYMERADIYLMTSDYNEGWGVVVNESLNSACVVIADYAAGSVPYMIENGKTGFVYKGDITTVFPIIKNIINNEDLRREVQTNAYNYMINNATPELVAKRFIDMCEGKETFNDGFCSPAQIIKSKWF